jgi:phage antirepressor YoqD-like protein
MFDLSTTTAGNAAITMTSLELVDFINGERGDGEAILAHSDLLKKVPQVLGGGAGNFSFTYRDVQNKERPCYRFPKREACLMAMSYSYDLQAKVFDRMTALEEKAAQPAFDPASLSRMDILKMAIESEGKLIQATALLAKKDVQLAIATPKAEALDRIAMADGMLNLQTAGKVLQQPPNKFIQQLRELRWIYKPPGCTTNRAHVEKINTGYLACKAYEMTMPDGTTRVRDQVLVTPKGLAKLALLLGARPEFGLTA